MSYWYERFTKKYIIVLLLNIILVLVAAVSQNLGGYSTGLVATASRTLFDWIAVDASFGYFEIYPYVQMQLEAGCTEWLGFSTCETVQFKEWMDIWTTSEQFSVTIWNVTSDGSSFSTIPPLTVERSYTDGGSASFGGQLSLRLKSTSLLSGSSDQDVSSTVTIPNLLHVAAVGNKASATNAQNLLSKVKVSTLLSGAAQGGVVYFNMDSFYKNQALNVPAKGLRFKKYSSEPSKTAGVKGLLFFTSIEGNQERCLANPYCSSQCSWSNLCEPLQYGHHGLLLPSANFFTDYSSVFMWSHWPDIAWNYLEYCPADGAAAQNKLTIFNPEIFVHSKYENTGQGSLEKYPGVSVWLWKHVKFSGSCSAGWTDGKDCDSEMFKNGLGYVNVDFASKIVPSKSNKMLYASLPQTQDGVDSLPEIYSETVSGLQLDFVDFWQMNALIQHSTTGASEKSQIYPLFWVSRRPGAKLSISERFTKDFQGYGVVACLYAFAGWGLYTVFSVAYVYVLCWGLTLLHYWKEVEKNFSYPVYI